MVQYWQIASGAGDRDYSGEFLEFGIAFVGGDYWEQAVSKIEEGDVIVLRRGLSEIIAVGKGIKPASQRSLSGCGDKDWLRDFDGWDLPAYCWVEWYLPSRNQKKVELSRKHSISQIADGQALRQLADEILESGSKCNSKHEDPPLSKCVKISKIEDHLRKRLGNESAKKTVATICEIRKLAQDYYDYGYAKWDHVKEHEIRTFLIIPLLLALGWDQRNIKIEITPKKLGVENKSGFIDIACLSQKYNPKDTQSNANSCVFIIESKRLSSGIGNEAVEQAKEYAEGISSCKLVFVSNGYCYKAFRRKDGTFSNEPEAYMNLLKLKTTHPLNPDIKGTLEMLDLLSSGSLG